MRPLTATLALFCLAGSVPADEKETGPVVVDFTPLVGTKEPTISMTIYFENGDRLRDYRGKSNSPVKNLKDAAAWADSFASVLNPPFDVEAVKGEPKLIIRGYKGKGVLSVECKAVGLPCENQPQVSRLKDDKKEDKKDKK